MFSKRAFYLRFSFLLVTLCYLWTCQRVLNIEREVKLCETSLVSQEVGHSDVLLPILSEFGPVGRYFLCVLHQALKNSMQLSLFRIRKPTLSTKEAIAMAVRLLVLLNTLVRVSPV